jgi:hypothetical protein
MILVGDHLWTCSSSDHTMRIWNTLTSPVRSAVQVFPLSHIFFSSPSCPFPPLSEFGYLLFCSSVEHSENWDLYSKIPREWHSVSFLASFGSEELMEVSDCGTLQYDTPPSPFSLPFSFLHSRANFFIDKNTAEDP